MQETWVQFRGQEDPLEKGMATHSSIVAWRIPWTEEPCGLHGPQGHKESDMTEQLHFLSFLSPCPISLFLHLAPLTSHGKERNAG